MLRHNLEDAIARRTSGGFWVNISQFNDKMVKGGTLGDDIGYGQFSEECIFLRKLLQLKVYSCSFRCLCSIFGTRGHKLSLTFVFSPFNLEAKSSLVDYHTKRHQVCYNCRFWTPLHTGLCKFVWKHFNKYLKFGNGAQLELGVEDCVSLIRSHSLANSAPIYV